MPLVMLRRWRMVTSFQVAYPAATCRAGRRSRVCQPLRVGGSPGQKRPPLDLGTTDHSFEAVFFSQLLSSLNKCPLLSSGGVRNGQLSGLSHPLPQRSTLVALYGSARFS